MKKFFISVTLTVLLLKASADEGMWLPMLLGRQVYADMVKKGLKLTRAQLYSINKSSLKDANFSMRVSYGNVKSYSPRDAEYWLAHVILAIVNYR